MNENASTMQQNVRKLHIATQRQNTSVFTSETNECLIKKKRTSYTGMDVITRDDILNMLNTTLPKDKHSYSTALGIAVPSHNFDKICDGIYLGNEYANDVIKF